jgi:ribosomal-protein-alanine N-acetyltransferase
VISPTIRVAEASDLDALAALERACFQAPWTDRDLREALVADRGLVLVADEAGGLPVAYALCLRLGDEAELLRIGVDPATRGRGIAGLLLDATLARLRELGIRRCWLEVRPSNRTALRLYAKHGFRHEGTRRRYYADGEDALLYVRDEGAPPPRPPRRTPRG